MEPTAAIGKFEITKYNLDQNLLELKCIEASDSELLQWKLQSVPKNIRIGKMTIQNSGKAIVQNKRAGEPIYAGSKVRFFHQGKEEDA